MTRSPARRQFRWRHLTALLAVAVALVVSGCTPTDAISTDRLSAPPMGWNSWNHFGCAVSEADVEAAADAIVADGLRAAGYDYVNVDDCWQAPTRERDGELQADPKRFPDGIANLAAYVHSRGLRFGIYAAPGSLTCAERYQGYPGRLGSLGHVRQDADTFASWGVDYLKYDWCGADNDGLGHEQAFAQMRAALNHTARRIVLSIHDKPEQPAQAWRQWVSDLSRTTPDIQDSWTSMISNALATARAPASEAQGHWNDPDMLEVGNGGMTTTEQRTHFSLWAELAAPLLIGCDLPGASATTLRVLDNRAVIGVDQDALADLPTILSSPRGTLVLTRRLAGGGSALTITNLTDHSIRASLPTSSLGLSDGYTGTDLWSGATVKRADHDVRLAAHATVMYRFDPANDHTEHDAARPEFGKVP